MVSSCELIHVNDDKCKVMSSCYWSCCGEYPVAISTLGSRNEKKRVASEQSRTCPVYCESIFIFLSLDKLFFSLNKKCRKLYTLNKELRRKELMACN